MLSSLLDLVILSCHSYSNRFIFNYRYNDESLLKLLTTLYNECFGDRIQAQLLVIAYYQAKNKTKQCQMNKMISSVQQVQPLLLYDGAFKYVMNEVDNIFKKTNVPMLYYL